MRLPRMTIALVLVFLCGSLAFGKLANQSAPTFTTTVPTVVQPSFTDWEHSPIATPDGSFPYRYKREQRSFLLEQPKLPVVGSEMLTPPEGWSAQSSPVTFQVYSISAVSRDVAWIVGTNAVVLRTTDGGVTWTNVTAAPVTGSLYSVTAVDANLALTTTSASSTSIYRTTNGGTTWTEVYTQAGGFINVVHMFDANNGFAQGDPVGGVWTLLKTTNGGATWTPISTPLAQDGTEAGWNNSMSFVGTTHLWFGTNNSRIYKSTDGGDTWTGYPVSIGSTVSVSFLNVNQGICGGSPEGLARTNNGGTTWTAQTPPGSGSVSGAAASGTRDFWIFQGGTVWRSPDKGVSWVDSYTPAPSVNWADIDATTYAGGDTTSVWAGATNGSIGAFYGTVTPLPPANDIRPIALLDPTEASKRRTNFSPMARFQNAGSALQSSIPVRLEILNSGGSVIYFNNQSIPTLAAEDEYDVTFATFTIPGTAGTYRARAISQNSDAIPGNDTLTVEFYVPANLSGTYTVGAGGNLASIKAMADTLNENDIAGPTTFELITNGTYNEPPIRFNGITFATTPQPVVIKPATGVNARIKVADPTDIGYALSFNNAYNLTIEGSNTLDAATTNLTIECDTTVTGVFTTALELNTVRDFTVRNTNIWGYHSTTGAASAVVMGTTGGLANRNVLFENVKISRTFRDVFHGGNSASNPDTGIVFRNCQLGTVGGSITIASGFYFRNTDSLVLENNVINGIQLGGFAGSRDMFGISLGGATRSRVSGNVVRSVANGQVAANAYYVAGIEVLGSSNRIWNNMVWDLSTFSTSIDARIRGIYVKGVSDEVYYNSVYLSGSTATNIISACFQQDSIVTLKNNILYNGRTDGTTGRSIALWKNTGQPLTSDYNLLYAPGATTGKLAAAVSTNYADLPSWTSATGQDGNSRRGNPQFANTNTSLHLSTSIPTPAEGGATAIVGITTDIDGDTRTSPDIGADEGTFIAALAADMAPLTVDDPESGVSKKAGVSFSPKATFANVGLNAQSSISVRFRIYEAGNLVTPIYDQTSSIASLAAGASQQVTFPSTSISTVGDYVARAITELGGDGNTSNDQLDLNFKVKNPLAGTYQVPSAEFPTLASVFSDLKTVGIAGGAEATLADVKFLLTASSYSQTTGLVLDSIPGASATSRVIIKPAPGVNATISGDIPAVNGGVLLTLNSCDYVVIDGSNVDGGTTRNLTIANTTTQTVAATIWVRSQGTARGATNNVIKNCNIQGGLAQNTSAGTVFGIVSSSSVAVPTPGDGLDNDKNQYINNYFTKLRVGIWLRGGIINRNDSTIISGNTFGPTAFGPDQIGRAGIILQLQDFATVTENEIRFVGGSFANTPTTSSPVDRIGIGLGSDTWPPVATTANGCVITRNVVHDIVDERGGAAIAIVVAGGNSAATPNYIANNMVYNVRSNGTTSGKHAAGLGIVAGNGARVVFNSVYMRGDMDPAGTTTATQSAAGIRVTAGTNLILKNNISHVNVTSNTGTLNHYAIVIPSGFSWGTGGSNYNNYYVNASNPQMVFGGLGTAVPYTNVADLTAWQSSPGQDANSVSANPFFTSTTNLHIVSASGSPVSNAGTPIAGITNDIDGDVRDASTPDIGADEFVSGASTIVQNGWNLISSPVTTLQDSVKQLFPTSSFDYAFAFSPGAGYVQRYKMQRGVGYWGKFPGVAGVSFSGTPVDEDSIDVVAGWNLIGSISMPVDTAYVRNNTTPPNIVTTNFYGYANGYGSGDAVLLPGKGYWVKVSTAGKLRLQEAPPPPLANRVPGTVLSGLNELTIRDASGNEQTLRFGTDQTREIQVEMFELPPLPPSGMFDARFTSAAGGQAVQIHGAEEGALFPVEIQSMDYPLTVEWNILAGEYELIDVSGRNEVANRTLTGTGAVQITNSAVNRIGIRLVRAGELPMEFALDQNYPNPFNPTTSIKFALPVESRVTVEIYNAIGQRVRTLVNESRPAGYHVAEWNGTGNTSQLLGSGVYFVRLDAKGVDGRSFTNLRKMLLLK